MSALAPPPLPDSPRPDLFPRSRPSWPIWVGAAVLAGVLHAGAVAAALFNAAPEDGADLGASAIEVGIELASPRQEKSDLPPGPESQQSAESTASIQQKPATPVEKTEEEPEPVKPVEDPERVVAEKQVEPPKEEQPVAAAQSSSSVASVASEATAPAVIETPREAPVATAPSLGVGESAVRVRTTWQRQLVAHLDKNKRYPGVAARRAAEILVSFTLDRTGKVVATNVLKSSGDAAFDEAALAMVRRASPVPAPPALVADDGLTFTVPVLFRPGGRG